MIDLFDYSGKTSEWLYTIISKSGMFNESLRERVVESARAELAKRGKVAT